MSIQAYEASIGQVDAVGIASGKDVTIRVPRVSPQVANHVDLVLDSYERILEFEDILYGDQDIYFGLGCVGHFFNREDYAVEQTHLLVLLGDISYSHLELGLQGHPYSNGILDKKKSMPSKRHDLDNKNYSDDASPIVSISDSIVPYDVRPLTHTEWYDHIESGLSKDPLPVRLALMREMEEDDI
jgi:hypothetical protein